MTTTSMEAVVRQRWSDVSATLDERRRRVWAATEARAGGRGGVSLLARVTGLSRPTIYAGLKELADGVASELPVERVRRRGGGRPPITQTQPGVLAALEALVEPTSRGDPESPLRWTCKGVRRLAAELQRQNFQIGRQKVADLLRDLDYSLQGNRKTREGNEHPDRNAQFEYIAATIADFQSRGQPVISVDTKKKELVGPSKMGATNGVPKARPKKSAFTIFSIRSWARRSPTVSLTCGRTKAGAASASTTPPPSSPPPPSNAGGNVSVSRAIL